MTGMNTHPSTARILAEFALPGTTCIHGVTFDGAHVWCAAAPGDDLHCVDPATGALVKKLGPTGCNAGTAFDGEHLWQIRDKKIDRIDRATGKTLRSIPAPPNAHVSGMAWAAGTLWVGDFNGRAIHKVDPETGNVLRTIRSERLVTGVTWAGSELWHGTYPEDEKSIEPGELREIDPESGAVRRRVHLPAGTLISGTEFDGSGRIWLGSLQRGKATLRAVKKP
jgi:outer membrane protein assembly factor BamB